MKCPKCGYENEDGAPFCNMCYEVLNKKPGAAKPAAPAGVPAYAPPAAAAAEPAAEADPDLLKKINEGFWSAILCGAITLIAALLAGSVEALAGIASPWMIIDAALIFGLAFGIRAKSRAAATIMLIYFAGSKIMMWVQTGKPSGLFITGLFCYYFFRAMTATYEYHSQSKA